MEKNKQIGQKKGVYTIIGMRGTGKSYWVCSNWDNILNDVERVYYIDVVGVFNNLYLEQFETQDITRLIFKNVPNLNKLKSLFSARQRSSDKIVILDISNLKRKDMVAIVDVFSEWILTQKDINTKTAIVFDEVGEIMPQTKEVYSEEFERVVRIGRNRGVTKIFLITQRPQKVDKHILSLSEYYIIFRLKHNLDLEAVRNLVGMGTFEFDEVSKKIKKQEVGSYLWTDGSDIEFIGQEIKEEKPRKPAIKPNKTDWVEVMKQAEKLRKEGLKWKEISEKLGYSVSTLKTKYSNMNSVKKAIGGKNGNN